MFILFIILNVLLLRDFYKLIKIYCFKYSKNINSKYSKFIKETTFYYINESLLIDINSVPIECYLLFLLLLVS